MLFHHQKTPTHVLFPHSNSASKVPRAVKTLVDIRVSINVAIILSFFFWSSNVDIAHIRGNRQLGYLLATGLNESKTIAPRRHAVQAAGRPGPAGHDASPIMPLSNGSLFSPDEEI